MNSLTLTPIKLVDTLIAPGAVYRSWLEAKSTSTMALAVILAVAAGSIYLLYSGMSNEWLLQQQSSATGSMSAAQLAAYSDIMEKLLPFSGPIAALTTAIFHLSIVLILAVYFNTLSAAKVISISDRTLGEWFAFSVWSQAPWILNYVGLVCLIITTQNTNLPLSLVDYASLNNLIFNFPQNHPYASVLTALNLFHFWSASILIVGLRQSCNLTGGKSVLLVFVPFTVGFLGWFIVASLA